MRFVNVKHISKTAFEVISANSQQAYSFQNVNLKNVDCIRQKPFLNDNNEVIVNIMVNKGDLKDFGKIQEQIPVGYTAESIKSKNSIFTYKNHIIKFLWMNMPQEAQFVVSYKLVPEGEIPDEEFKIVGTFSYAESDRTKTINIAERNVELESFDSEQVVAQETLTFEPSEPVASTTTPKQEPAQTTTPSYTEPSYTEPTTYTPEPSTYTPEPARTTEPTIAVHIRATEARRTMVAVQVIRTTTTLMFPKYPTFRRQNKVWHSVFKLPPVTSLSGKTISNA